MNILLLHYDLNKNINPYPDENIIKDTINSLFLTRTSAHFCWLYTIKRVYNRGKTYYDYSSIYWSLSNPRKEIFKELKVVSVY